MFRKISLPCLLLFAFAACTAAQEIEKPRLILRMNFEEGQGPDFAAPNLNPAPIYTTEPNEVIEGKRSLKGDSQASGVEWNEFFHSRATLFEANEAYRISFDYKVLARAENAKFYVLARRAGARNSEGWKEWAGKPGDTGHIETSFFTRKVKDFTLIFGIQDKGAVTIDNILIETDPANRLPDIKYPEPQRIWQSPGKRTYYVDAAHGGDANDGRSEKQAWRSLDRVNTGTFAPGDKILLRAGGSWHGFLAPGGSGTKNSPIVLDKYGSGPKPQIDAEGKSLATLSLFNVEGWAVRNLSLFNRGKLRIPNLSGVSVRLENFGVAHNISLQNLDIFDVTGSNVKSEGGGYGIFCGNGGSKVKSCFDGLTIESCRLERTDRNGIGFGGYWSRADWFPSLHVVIRKNVLRDIGGDGIVPIGCDGAVVEKNVIHGARMRCADSAAGIWPWSCDNTVVQYNEVSGMKGTVDGQGYDSDWNCRNSVFQYNYSHENEGGFMLICNDGSVKQPWSIGNIGTIIRYNISQNDGARTFNFAGPCRDTEIYNNTIYVGPSENIHIVAAGNWGGDWTENTRFYNNIFHVDGKGNFDFGKMRQTVFEHNAFFGNLENRPEDAKALLTDPFLKAPGTGKDGFDTLSGYRLTNDSPCLRRGRQVPNNGGHDFWNQYLPRSSNPSIGAFQPASD